MTGLPDDPRLFLSHHHGWCLCSGLPPGVGCQVQGLSWHHIGQRGSVYPIFVVCSLFITQHDPPSDNNLPPQSNILVERFHQSLKASQHASLTSSYWMDNFTGCFWVCAWCWLNFNSSLAELMFHHSQLLSGEYSSHCHLDLHSSPSQTHRHLAHKSTPVPGLCSSDLVFFRHDSQHRPLQVPYHGPFRVMSHHDKYFVNEMSNLRYFVSFDWLKTAHLVVTNLWWLVPVVYPGFLCFIKGVMIVGMCLWPHTWWLQFILGLASFDQSLLSLTWCPL